MNLDYEDILAMVLIFIAVVVVLYCWKGCASEMNYGELQRDKFKHEEIMQKCMKERGE